MPSLKYQSVLFEYDLHALLLIDKAQSSLLSKGLQFHAFHNKISVANLFILIMGFPNVPKSPVWTDIRGKMPALCLYFSDFAHFCESESGYSGESVNL